MEKPTHNLQPSVPVLIDEHQPTPVATDNDIPEATPEIDHVEESAEASEAENNQSAPPSADVDISIHHEPRSRRSTKAPAWQKDYIMGALKTY